MSRHAARHGYSLLEVLVYMALLAALMGLAYPALYRARSTAGQLRRNADDILWALRAGERWRQDVRSATESPRVTGGALHIPQRAGEVVYWFADGTVWRKQTAEGAAAAVLRNVARSDMQPDAHEHVTAWRWELELAGTLERPRMRPLFSFQAVAPPTS
jgi:type II secretory pathway pseudopilin PulG